MGFSVGSRVRALRFQYLRAFQEFGRVGLVKVFQGILEELPGISEGVRSI